MRAVAENVRATRPGATSTCSSRRTSTGITSPAFCRRSRCGTSSRSGRCGSPGRRIPQDELATELRTRKQSRLNGLVAAAKLAGGTGIRSSTGCSASRAISVRRRPRRRGKALAWVKDRDATIRYLRPGEQLFDLRGLRGIRVYVLGPPHDSRLIKRSDPSKAHSEVYELAGGRRRPPGIHGGLEALAERRAAGDTAVRRFFRVGEAEAARRSSSSSTTTPRATLAPHRP